MLIKTFESHIARFLACCLFPCSPGLAHALPVLLDGTTDGFLVRRVHNGLSAAPRTCFETVYAICCVPLHRCTYRHGTHLRLYSCLRSRKAIGFQKNCAERIRKQCFSPKRNPLSSSRCCVPVNSNTFGFPITNNRTGIPYTYFI